MYGDLITRWCILGMFIIVHRSTCVQRYAHMLVCIESLHYCAQKHLCMALSHMLVCIESVHYCAQEHLCTETCSHAGPCTNKGRWSTTGTSPWLSTFVI